MYYREEEPEMLENDHEVEVEEDISPEPVEVAPDESEASEPVDMRGQVQGRRNPDLPTVG